MSVTSTGTVDNNQGIDISNSQADEFGQAVSQSHKITPKDEMPVIPGQTDNGRPDGPRRTPYPIFNADGSMAYGAITHYGQGAEDREVVDHLSRYFMTTGANTNQATQSASHTLQQTMHNLLDSSPTMQRLLRGANVLGGTVYVEYSDRGPQGNRFTNDQPGLVDPQTHTIYVNSNSQILDDPGTLLSFVAEGTARFAHADDTMNIARNLRLGTLADGEDNPVATEDGSDPAHLAAYAQAQVNWEEHQELEDVQYEATQDGAALPRGFRPEYPGLRDVSPTAVQSGDSYFRSWIHAAAGIAALGTFNALLRQFNRPGGSAGSSIPFGSGSLTG